LAASVDLSSIDAVAQHDPLWNHSIGRYLSDLAVLLIFAAAAFALLRRRLREPDVESNSDLTERKAKA
jgi:hypothetical protein